MFISLQVQNHLRWHATAIGMILLPDAPLVTFKRCDYWNCDARQNRQVARDVYFAYNTLGILEV